MSSGGKDTKTAKDVASAPGDHRPSGLARRDFLKVAGVGAGLAAAGCEQAPRNIYPYIVPPRVAAVGEATVFATICRECPAGCGVHARVREGRPVKLEGNPHHPINRGVLCGRGQAGLQTTYNADRPRGPMGRGEEGFEPDRWRRVLGLVGRELRSAADRGPGRVVLWTGLETGTLEGLYARLAESLGGEHLMFDPHAPEALLEAHRLAFGRYDLPQYSLAEADLVLALEADLFETYPSPVELGRQVVGLDRGDRERAQLVWAGPRRGVTGMLADHWVPTRPGASGLLALALLGRLASTNGRVSRAVAEVPGLRRLLEANPPEALLRRAGVDDEDLTALVDRIQAARRPVALPPGVLGVGPYAVAGAASAVLLNAALGAYDSLLVFGAPSALSSSAKAGDLRASAERMAAGEVDVLVLSGVNPIFDLPGGLDLEAAFERVGLVVAVTDQMNASAERANFVLAASSPLESWGDYSPRFGTDGLLQPTLEPIFDTRMVGDIVIGMAAQAGVSRLVSPRGRTFEAAVRARWAEAVGLEGRAAADAFREAQRRGGTFDRATPVRPEIAPAVVEAIARGLAQAEEPEADSLFVAPYAPIGAGLGERASGGWLDELPEPTTAAVWGSPAEINRNVAARLGLEHEGSVRITAGERTIELPVAVVDSVREDTIAVPLDGGPLRFEQSPGRLLPAEAIVPGAGVARAGQVVTVSRGGGQAKLHVEARHFDQHGRQLARARGVEVHAHPGHHGSHYEGLYEHREPTDMYGPRHYEGSRWGMVIDLDRCTGCGACIVACYAENNISVVGPEDVDYGREMAWLQLHVYWERDHADRPIPLSMPVLCQHCHQAPCESVCPVYAPYHTPEGLNGQVYNRCVGTRFCSNNCPYKVRRFNWRDWERPWPVNLQLNPDVTTRSAGVMEKCTFCHQRIRAAQEQASLDGTELGDGDIVPACQQTCPTGAIVFGDLADEESRVSQLARSDRGYHLLDWVGTRPAITYLERVVRWRR